MASPSITIPSDLNTLLTNAINQIIQSNAVQDLQWAMTSGCQPSVLNNMYFCSAASVSGSQTIIPHTDSSTAHYDLSDADHVDNPPTDHVDNPPSAHVDSTSHDDTAGYQPLDIPHTDTHPHDDTGIPHDDTELPHDDTGIPHDDIPGVHDDIGSSFNYSAALTQVTGAGSLFVTDVAIAPAAIANPPATETAMAFTAALGFGTPITAHFTTHVQETGLPALDSNNSFAVTGTTGTVTGEVTLYCTGNAAGLPSGYYAKITAMTVNLPTSVTDYSAWSGIVSSMIELGLDTANAVGEGDALLAMVTGLVNGLIASEIESELNSVLATMMLAPCGC